MFAIWASKENKQMREQTTIIVNGSKWVKVINQHFFVLFDLILDVPSTIFQFNRDGSSWVEPVLG